MGLSAYQHPICLALSPSPVARYNGGIMLQCCRFLVITDNDSFGAVTDDHPSQLDTLMKKPGHQDRALCM